MHLMRRSKQLPGSWRWGLWSGFPSGLLLSAIVLLPVQTLAAELTALARLSFWVAPERMADFEQVYEERIVPLLDAHGLVPSERTLREQPRTRVLLTGEPGTGKQQLARALHFGSSRGEAAFVTVPCGALPQDLQEIVGHVTLPAPDDGRVDIIDWCGRHLGPDRG